MLDFIPHYYCNISPLALGILALVIVGSLVGWATIEYSERKR